MKILWERFRFYLFAFVMGTAVPSFGAYLAGEKYDDPVIFPACTSAVVGLCRRNPDHAVRA